MANMFEKYAADREAEQKKIEKAQIMLLTEDTIIKEMAYNLGFKDHSYFIRLFKKVTGQTPMEFRSYR